MFKRIIVSVFVLTFAAGILLISILRTASVKYSFSLVNADSRDKNLAEKSREIDEMKINYYLAYPGPVLPGSILWPLKAARDKVWLALTTNITRKAELNLLFADKRIGASRILFENKKSELGYSTLTKAQKYFQEAVYLEKEARVGGVDTKDLAINLLNASFKYRQEIDKMLLVAPDDAKAQIILIQNFFRDFYASFSQEYKNAGYPIPEDPFNKG